MNARLYIAGLIIATLLFPIRAGAALSREVETRTDSALLAALSAEWALMVGDEAQALSLYLQALATHQDAALAERATFLALNMGAGNEAYQAAKIWASLAPANGQAQEIYLHLTFLQDDQKNETPAFLALLQSEHPEIEVALSDLYQGLQSEGKARLRELTQTHLKNATHPEALMLALAHFYFSDRDFSNALKMCDAALAKAPHHKQGIILKSELLRLGVGEDKSIAYLEKICRQNQESEILMYAVDVFLKNKKPEKALPILEKLTHTEKKSAALLYLAQLSLDKKDNKKAIGYLESVKNDPIFSDAALYFLGRIYEEMRDTNKAVIYYSQVSGGEYELTAHLFANDILLKQKKYSEALEMLDAVRPDDPDELKTLTLHKADTLFQSGNAQAAFNILEEGLKDFPDDIELSYAQAVTAEQLQKFDLMEARLRAVIQQDPKHVDALNALGYNFANRKIHLDEALSLLKRAYALDPANPLVLDSLGWINYRLGKYKEATEYTKKALSLSADPEISLHLGQILWAAGDTTGARHIISVALQRNPAYPALQALAKQYAVTPAAAVVRAEDAHERTKQ